jgi:hypothetical protein
MRLDQRVVKKTTGKSRPFIPEPVGITSGSEDIDIAKTPAVMVQERTEAAHSHLMVERNSST